MATISEAQELPSLNYWEISYQLSRFDEVRNALEISPSQEAAIVKMRADPKWATIFNQKEIDLITKHGEKYAGQSLKEQFKVGLIRERINVPSRRDAYVAANDLVKDELGKTLNADQMSALVKVMLRGKFHTGMQPLDDREVRGVCQLREEELSKQVRAKLKQLESDYEAKVDRYRHESLVKIVDSLPAATKQRFVNFASNKYAPNIAVDLNRANVPRPVITDIDLLIEDLELQRQLDLTKRQIDQLQNVKERYDADYGELFEQRKIDKATIEMLDSQLEKSTKGILGQTQLRQLEQYLGNLYFEDDCRKPFTIPRFAQYLEPDAKLQATYLKTVTIERESLLKKIRIADQEVFLASCDLLPSHSSEILKKLFEGVWEIDVEGFRWEDLH